MDNKKEKKIFPTWGDWLIIPGFLLMGSNILMHPEVLTEVKYASWMCGGFMISAGLLWWIKLREAAKTKKIDWDEYVDRLPKAKGKFEE